MSYILRAAQEEILVARSTNVWPITNVPSGVLLDGMLKPYQGLKLIDAAVSDNMQECYILALGNYYELYVAEINGTKMAFIKGYPLVHCNDEPGPGKIVNREVVESGRYVVSNIAVKGTIKGNNLNVLYYDKEGVLIGNSPLREEVIRTPDNRVIAASKYLEDPCWFTIHGDTNSPPKKGRYALSH